jgi:uncharacterized C2H2 Zn-finger protein
MIPVIITLGALFVAGIWWLELRVKQLWARQLSTLASLRCPACGQVFGQSVANAARAAHLAHCEEARRQHPNCKINFARSWPVRCPACSSTSECHYETLQLQTRNA